MQLFHQVVIIKIFARDPILFSSNRLDLSKQLQSVANLS